MIFNVRRVFACNTDLGQLVILDSRGHGRDIYGIISNFSVSNMTFQTLHVKIALLREPFTLFKNFV
jgi:hypothetical protein